MRTCSRTAILFVLVSLMGCLPFGLGDPEQSRADDQLNGFWISTDSDGAQVLWCVSGYDSRTMLVSQYVFKRNGDAIEPDERGTFKAWLTPIGGKTFITLESKSAGRLVKPDDNVFMSAQLEVSGNKIIARGIKPDYVTEQQIDSSEKLTKFVSEHLDDAQMYVDALNYERLTKDRYPEAKKILKAFGDTDGE